MAAAPPSAPPQEVNANLNNSIELVFPPNGAELNLNDQRPRVAHLLRSTIVKVELDLVFKDAFPQEPLRQVVVPNALITVARSLNDDELLARICNDHRYRHALARIVRTPLSSTAL